MKILPFLRARQHLSEWELGIREQFQYSKVEWGMRSGKDELKMENHHREKS